LRISRANTWCEVWQGHEPKGRYKRRGRGRTNQRVREQGGTRALQTRPGYQEKSLLTTYLKHRKNGHCEAGKGEREQGGGRNVKYITAGD